MSDLHNAFLLGLDKTSRDRLQENLAAVDLPLGKKVFEQGAAAEWVYFPISSLILL